MESLVDTITLILIVRVVSYKLPKLVEQEKATSDEFLNCVLTSVKRRACYAQIFNFEEAYLKTYLHCLEENSIKDFPFNKEFLTSVHVQLKGIEKTVKDLVERIQVAFGNGPRPDPAAMIDQGTSTNDEEKSYTVYTKRYLNFGYLVFKFQEKTVSSFCLGTFKNIITVNNCHNTWKKELRKHLLQ